MDSVKIHTFLFAFICKSSLILISLTEIASFLIYILSSIPLFHITNAR